MLITLQIHHMDPTQLIRANDRNRLLIWALSRVRKGDLQNVISVYDNTPFSELKSAVIDALSALVESAVEGNAKLSSEPHMFIASWWVRT